MNNYISNKKKLNTFFSVLLVFSVSIVKGQTPAVTLPTISPPSVNASALGAYGEYPVSYSNGTPQIAIPLYELKTSRFNIPISLSYHANGIKVDEFATNVGLGWSLNAGGVITRQINDLPDFDQYGFSNIMVPSQFDTNTDDINYFAGKVTKSQTNAFIEKWDSQPDDFFFNFVNKSGAFKLKNTIGAGAPTKFTTVPFTPIKITYTPLLVINQVSQGDSFKITDTNGDTYYFGRSISNNNSATETSDAVPSSGIDLGPKVTAWYLTEMVSADRTDTVYFKYTQPIPSWVTYTSNVLNYQWGNATFDYTPQPYFNTSSSTNTTYNIYLTEIDSKNGKVVFNYNTRQDNGNNRLSKITVFRLNGGAYQELKGFNLYQSYFTSEQASSQIVTDSVSAQSKRLRLDSLVEEGSIASVTKPPYVFTYYGLVGTNYLVPYIGEYKQDLWGYYNKGTIDNTSGYPANLLFPSSAYKGANRVPDSASMIAGTIHTIQYPTGGKTVFQFEPNQIIRHFVDHDSTFYTQSYQMSNFGLAVGSTAGTDTTFTAPKTIDADFQFSVYSMCTPSGNCVSNQPSVYLYDLTQAANTNLLTGTSPGTISSYPYNYTQTISLTKGHQYRMVFPTPGMLSNNSQTIEYRLQASLSYDTLTSVRLVNDSALVLTGGLRIKRIISSDSLNHVLLTKRYNYTGGYFTSNVFLGDFTTVGSGYNFTKKQAVPGSWSLYGPTLVNYIQTITENFTVPMAGSSNGSLAYSQVEEYQDDASGNSLGKTVYNFNIDSDDANDVFAYTKTNRSWRRSQLIEQRSYKVASGNYTLLKDTKNTYTDFFVSSQDTINTLIAHRVYNSDDFEPIANGVPDYASISFSGQQFDGCINGNDIFNQNQYQLSWNAEVVPRNALTNTTTIIYDTNGANPVTDQVTYAYNNPNNLMVSTKTHVNSNQNTEIQRNLYTPDYNIDQCGSCYATLATQLSSLKVSYATQELPVYQQWWNEAVARQNVLGFCTEIGNRGSSNFNTCIVTNQYNQNDASILSLYNQYGSLVSAYNTAVAQAITNYNQCVANYNSCFITQLSTSPNSALLQMQSENILAPIETTNTLQSYSKGNEYLISDKKIGYQITNNMVEPLISQHSETPTELLYTTYISQPGQYMVTDMTYDAFDPTGNIRQYTQNGGAHVSYQWGYNNQYPVAKVSNAKANDIFYDSFEEGDGNGVMGDSKTGHYSYSGATVPYTKTLNNVDAGTYTLSYWQKNTSTGGWVFQTGTVTVPPGSSSYPISINGQIDDVRFYPVNAQMMTYTYDPLIGVTSSTDAKSETTYYEYDAFQRLLNIKDQYGNITKSYCYNYAGQAYGCNIGVINSSPPYVQITLSSSGSTVDANGNAQTNNIYTIKTFSDAPCTIPYTLSTAITVNYQINSVTTYNASGETISSSTPMTLTVAAGSSQASTGSIMVNGCTGTSAKGNCSTSTVVLSAGTTYLLGVTNSND